MPWLVRRPQMEHSSSGHGGPQLGGSSTIDHRRRQHGTQTGFTVLGPDMAQRHAHALYEALVHKAGYTRTWGSLAFGHFGGSSQIFQPLGGQ